jgi:hypothetical protein
MSVWVARTCSTSEVPIPKASAPNAPWVEVWESEGGSARGGVVLREVSYNDQNRKASKCERESELTSADDGRSRKGESLLRSDDVDDT